MDRRTELRRALSFLAINAPLLGFFASALGYVAVDDPSGPPAWTDGKRIYLNFAKLQGGPDLVAALAHEALHVVMLHPVRMAALMEYYAPVDPVSAELLRNLINFVQDAKVWQYGHTIIDSISAVTLEDLENAGVSDPASKSVETIVAELLRPSDGGRCSSSVNTRRGRACVLLAPRDGHSDVRPGGEVRDGEVLREPSEEIARARSAKELEAALRRKLAEALVAAKQAGTVPGALERFIESLLSPKLPWRTLLRMSIEPAIGRDVRKVFSRPSKKAMLLGIDEVPSRRTMGFGRVLVLMDVSGSIGQEELRQFAAEIRAIVGESHEVVVIEWDADVQGVFELRSERDVRKVRVRGGGGTVIAPALRRALKMMRGGDIVVILSDWEIYDARSRETQRLLAEVARRSSAAFAVSTYAEPVVPSGYRRLKIEL